MCILFLQRLILFCFFDFFQYGRAPIHWASSRGNIEIMEMLINAKCDIEAKDKVIIIIRTHTIFYSYIFEILYVINY